LGGKIEYSEGRFAASYALSRKRGRRRKKKSGWKSLKVVFLCVCGGKDAAEIFDQRWEGKYGCGRENFYSLKEPLIKL